MMIEKKHLSEPELNEYLDGELTPADGRRAEAHLESCADCREKLEDLKMVFMSLDTLGEKDLKVDLTGRIMDQLQPRRNWAGWVLVPEGLLAIYLVVVTRPWESSWVRWIPDLLYRAATLVPEFDPRVLSDWISGQWQRLGGGITFNLRFLDMPLQSWLILMVCVFAAWLAGNGLLLRRNDNKQINGR